MTLMAQGQKTYIVQKDSTHPEPYFFNGMLTKEDLTTDSSMNKWYTQSLSYFRPDTNVVKAFKEARAKNYKFLLFGGTWCEDSQFVIPKFFKLQELSGIPDTSVSFFTLDRNKKMIGNLENVLGVQNVPAIVVLKDGKEVGRVIEYGKTGRWDKEVAALLQ